MQPLHGFFEQPVGLDQDLLSSRGPPDPLEGALSGAGPESAGCRISIPAFCGAAVSSAALSVAACDASAAAAAASPTRAPTSIAAPAWDGAFIHAADLARAGDTTSGCASATA